MASGGGVLLTFRGLPPDATEADLREVVNAPVHSVSIQRAGGKVLYGECRMNNPTEALNVLRTCNFTMVRRCAVKIQLGTGKQPLPPNQRIEVPRLLPGVGEPEVFGYFRQFGTIIRIEVDQQTASVWYANTPEAQRAGSKVNGCGLVGTVPVYEILDSDEEEDGVVTGNNMRLDIVEERGWVRPSAAVRAPSLAPQVPKPEPPTEQTKADLPMATAKRPRPEPTVARKPVQPAAKQSVPVQAPAQPPLRPTAMTEPKGDTTQSQILVKGVVLAQPNKRPHSAPKPANGGTPIQLPRPTVPPVQRARAQRPAVRSLAPARSTRSSGAPGRSVRLAQQPTKASLTIRAPRPFAVGSVQAQLSSATLDGTKGPVVSASVKPPTPEPLQLRPVLQAIDTAVRSQVPVRPVQPSETSTLPVKTSQTAPACARVQNPTQPSQQPSTPPVRLSSFYQPNSVKRSFSTQPSPAAAPATPPMSASLMVSRQVHRSPSVPRAQPSSIQPPNVLPRPQLSTPRSAVTPPARPAATAATPRPPATAVATAPCCAAAVAPTTRQSPTPRPAKPSTSESDELEPPAKRAKICGLAPTVGQLSSPAKSPTKPQVAGEVGALPATGLSQPSPPACPKPSQQIQQQQLVLQQPATPSSPDLSLTSAHYPNDKESSTRQHPQAHLAAETYTMLASSVLIHPAGLADSPMQSAGQMLPADQRSSSSPIALSPAPLPASLVTMLKPLRPRRSKGYASKSARAPNRIVPKQAIQQFYDAMGAVKDAGFSLPRNYAPTKALRHKPQSTGNHAQPQPQSQANRLLAHSSKVRDFYTMDQWRLRAPFVYDLFNSRLMTYKGLDMNLPLSIACDPKTTESGTIAVYLSMGSSRLNVSDPDEQGERVASVVTKANLGVDMSNSFASIGSALGQFRRIDMQEPKYGKNQDKYTTTVRSLRMYDGGSVMFGCTGHSIIVWDMGVFSQKGALRLMGGTNGVYDVNGDYLLANTPQSKIGVWKRGASSLTWGYNGMRRFMNKDESDGCRIATAIKVAKTAPKAYVGDMMGGLSLCDFRDRYIDQPSLTLKGAVKGIETFREWGLAVGTDEGELSLFDLRFLKKNAEKSVVQRLELPADEKSIGMIRACPQNPDMFACSAGRYVCIYDVSANKNGTSPWFVHDVHQSPVVDFDWSPCDMYQYTISSLEAASGHSPGKLHTWRPNTMALSGT